MPNKNKSTRRSIKITKVPLVWFILAIIAIAIPLTVFISSQQQDNRSNASEKKQHKNKKQKAKGKKNQNKGNKNTYATTPGKKKNTNQKKKRVASCKAKVAGIKLQSKCNTTKQSTYRTAIVTCSNGGTYQIKNVKSSCRTEKAWRARGKAKCQSMDKSCNNNDIWYPTSYPSDYPEPSDYYGGSIAPSEYYYQ